MGKHIYHSSKYAQRSWDEHHIYLSGSQYLYVIHLQSLAKSSDHVMIVAVTSGQGMQCMCGHVCAARACNVCAAMYVLPGHAMYMWMCRWDNCCCEDGQWQKAAQVSELENGGEQTFYHLLVDAKDWEASWEKPPVAYVAEELLQAPEVRIILAFCFIRSVAFASVVAFAMKHLPLSGLWPTVQLRVLPSFALCWEMSSGVRTRMLQHQSACTTYIPA